MSPQALTATIAATVPPPGRETDAEPMPLRRACAPGTSLPTVAPVPAPTRPKTGSAVAARSARSPMAASGRTCALPTARS